MVSHQYYAEYMFDYQYSEGWKSIPYFYKPKDYYEALAFVNKFKKNAESKVRVRSSIVLYRDGREL